MVHEWFQSFYVVNQAFSPREINLPEKFKFLHLWNGLGKKFHKDTRDVECLLKAGK